MSELLYWSERIRMVQDSWPYVLWLVIAPIMILGMIGTWELLASADSRKKVIGMESPGKFLLLWMTSFLVSWIILTKLMIH